jgi:hypothetical protein
VHLGDSASKLRARLHLREHVGQEQHLAVAGAGDERVLGVAGVLESQSAGPLSCPCRPCARGRPSSSSRRADWRA